MIDLNKVVKVQTYRCWEAEDGWIAPEDSYRVEHYNPVSAAEDFMEHCWKTRKRRTIGDQMNICVEDEDGIMTMVLVYASYEVTFNGRYLP